MNSHSKKKIQGIPLGLMVVNEQIAFRCSDGKQRLNWRPDHERQRLSEMHTR